MTLQELVKDGLRAAAVAGVLPAEVNKTELASFVVTSIVGSAGRPQPRRLPVFSTRVIEAAAEWSGYSFEDIVGKRRFAELVEVRHVAMYVCRNLSEPTMSYPLIALHFGHRDHQAALNAIKKIERLRLVEPRIDDMVRDLTEIVSARLPTRRKEDHAAIHGG